LFIIVQQLGLAALSFIEDSDTFLLVSFISQAIGGIGSGINGTASMALVVSSSKKNDRERNIGLIEMATGIGFLFGPLWGSFMFEMGGYFAPFFSMVNIYIFFTPVIWYILN